MKSNKWLGLLGALSVAMAPATFAAQITATGFLKDERFDGSTRPDVEDPAFAGTPTVVRYVPSFEVPVNQADNFAERVSGIFTPAVSGNYVFFVCSDDDADLFLSTDATPANKKLIAQETTWSNSREWTSSTGNSDLTSKRSDQFSGTEWGNTITLTAGTKYYIEAVKHDGGGGDDLSATFILEGQPDPANGSAPKLTGNLISTIAQDQGITITINTQPASVSAQEKKTATLSVAASGSQSGGGTPTLYYQWQTKPPAGANFADIPGATEVSYTTGLLSFSNSLTQFRVVVYAPGISVTSSVATVTVVSDTTPPTVVGATAFPNTKKVGLMFDEALDPASAGNAANYKVNGAVVTSAVVRTNVANELTNEKNLVQLTVATALTTNFTVTVSGVKDALGNAMTEATVSGKTLNLTVTDIGSPNGEPGGPDPQVVPGQVTTWGPGAFDVLTTGSNDYWNNADGFNFVWAPKTNSFDVKVRVVSVSPINNWTAGAIEVREGPPTPDGGGWELSRHYFAKVDYGGGDERIQVLDNSGMGANSYEFNGRRAPGDPTLRETANTAPGGSVGWGGTGPGNPSPVPYPNAWIRIARVKNGTNDHLLGFSSSDGVNWSQRQDVDLNDDTHAGFLNIDGNPAGPMPDVLYVGLGSTSHTGIGNSNSENTGASTGPFQEFWYSPLNQPYSAFIIYRDFGDFATSTGPPTLTFKVNADGTVTLNYTGNLYSSDTVAGRFTAVAGATSPFTVNPKTASKPITFYISGP